MFFNKNFAFLIILLFSLMLFSCDSILPKVASVLVRNQGEFSASINATASDGTPKIDLKAFQTKLEDAYFEGEGVTTEKKTINYDKSAWTRYNIFWVGTETLTLTFFTKIIYKYESIDSQKITFFDIMPNQVVYITVNTIKPITPSEDNKPVSEDNKPVSVPVEVLSKVVKR